MKPFTASDLPIDDDGSIYHIQVKQGRITPDILLVGDPGRADFIGETFLRNIKHRSEHRGLVTITGTADISGEPTTVVSPLDITVATSGIGTPSLEIVINELVALNEIDFTTRTRRSGYPGLHVIRVGTSGGLQPQTRLGTPIITTYAIGLDNAGLYYEVPHPDETCQRLEGEILERINDAMIKDSRFANQIRPYVTRADPAIVEGLLEASKTLGVDVRAGLTASAPGFSASQGRDISRIQPSVPDMDKILCEFDPKVGGQLIENMEMEASFLLHFMGGLGYRAGAICPAIANRQEDTFAENYREAIENATRMAILALATVRNRHPDTNMQ